MKRCELNLLIIWYVLETEEELHPGEPRWWIRVANVRQGCQLGCEVDWGGGCNTGGIIGVDVEEVSMVVVPT